MNQLREATMGAEQKKLIATKLKPVLSKFGLKGSLSVKNGSTITLTLTEGAIDFIGNSANVDAKDEFNNRGAHSTIRNTVKTGYLQVNVRQIQNHFTGTAKIALQQIYDVLNVDNYRESDWTNDWVKVGHYVSIHIGKFDKPYSCTGTLEKPNDKLKTILGDEPIKESTLYEDIDEHNFVKKCREVGQKYGVKIEVLAPSETTGKNTWVINIVSGKLDFVSNFVGTALRTKVASADIIKIANSKEWVTVHNKNYPQQFSGEPLKCVSELMKIGKQYVVAPNQLTVYIGGRMKRYSYLGPKKKITEDVKQLIQSPILKVFDQFGKQYLAQVLDASLNKMIQVAAKRGAKVTVPQLIAEIKDKPNGSTSQALFKAMATVIKQISAQIPTIVTTNVSSISEGRLTENEVIDSSDGVPDEILKQAKRTKDYYPYRIVFIVKDKNTKQWDVWAKPTMHSANKLAREGHEVHIVQRQ